jgi:hypothetical protein
MPICGSAGMESSEGGEKVMPVWVRLMTASPVEKVESGVPLVGLPPATFRPRFLQVMAEGARQIDGKTADRADMDSNRSAKS